ncbi:hypothetical protein HMPREF0063_10094 [Aeromicrobium marinum DSM 15272]|uniref:Uncharacterized protein n=1 Tax=Aeromicrobium marinum DSM 15272 TaxID=585531 RepID=E2S7T7_9ACTN|nr:hypothetical protein [Aeromicrobium marinum]EFQ84753.1 hypothetical protein HMPREF0063_10094 [Aeromicrobium marinum DSM 15272]
MVDPKAQANLAWMKATEVKNGTTSSTDYKVGECLEHLSLAIREIADRQNTIMLRQEFLMTKLIKS